MSGLCQGWFSNQPRGPCVQPCMTGGGCPLCVGCLYWFLSIFWPQILNILYFIFKKKKNVCQQPALFVVRGPIQNIVGFPLKT